MGLGVIKPIPKTNLYVPQGGLLALLYFVDLNVAATLHVIATHEDVLAGHFLRLSLDLWFYNAQLDARPRFCLSEGVLGLVFYSCQRLQQPPAPADNAKITKQS